MTESDDQLTAVGSQLVQEVQGLSRKFRWLKHLTIGLTVSFVVDLVVTIVLATVVNNQGNINHRLQQALAQNYTTAQEQKQTRTELLCPLYQLFIGLADNPVPGQTAQQLANAAKASAALHKQYARLDCPTPAPNP